jgi:hypothetical protein
MTATPFARMRLSGALMLVLLPLAPVVAHAQSKAPQQVVRPPVAQLWMDVATHATPGLPEMPGLPLPGLGGLLGGTAGGGNVFGNTRSGASGRYVDIALFTQRQPGGTEATQAVPARTGLAPGVPLLPRRAERVKPGGSSVPDPSEEPEVERPDPPKGRVLFYWGCGETVRPGQPRVLDFSKGATEEWGRFMQGRAVRERGAVARPGHSLWPNERDRRLFGRDASLVGDHAVSGAGVPADLRFRLAEVHDFMPPVALRQSGSPAEVLQLSWSSMPTARAFFINAMGGSEGEGEGTDLVLWSSAEVPDFGMGLMDYASPGNIDAWLRERVLLSPTATQCAIPRGIFARGQGAMLRMIAYGPELNLAHPPRPTDVNVPWEPDWAVRVRIKSTAMAMLGDGSARAAGADPRGEASTPGQRGEPAGAGQGRVATPSARPDCPPAGRDPGDNTAAAIGGALAGSVGRALGGALGGLLGRKDERRDVPADCPR